MGPEIIVFDLNGTLLDGHFARSFGSSAHREKWFEQLQVLWMTTIACGTYQPFEKLARAALEMLAAKEAGELSSADEKAVTSRMCPTSGVRSLPQSCLTRWGGLLPGPARRADAAGLSERSPFSCWQPPAFPGGHL